MIKNLLVLLALTPLAFAQSPVPDFTIQDHNYVDFLDYTESDFVRRLGVDPASLEHYRCNGVNEHDLFFPPLKENDRADSLRVLGNNGAKEPVVYRKGAYYKLSGKFTSDGGNPMLIQTMKELQKLERIKDGAKLLRFLERAAYPVSIELGNNQYVNRVDGKNFRGDHMASLLMYMAQGKMTGVNVPFNAIGNGGVIYWSPNMKNGLPPHIILGHELYHAFDAIRGLADSRKVVGETYERLEVSEFRATYFENLIRKASGYKLRTHYLDENAGGPGLLDSRGKPRLIPSPCLR